MEAPLSPAPEERSSGPWIGLGIGFFLIACTIAALIYSSRTSDTRSAMQPAVMNSTAADPYAAQLPLSNVNLSAADNLLGGTATYVEGTVTDSGDKTVTGATVEITFKNAMGQVVQRQSEPLWIVQTREPAIDVASLAVNPLKPGEKREFRLSFERISADWDRQPPQLRITVVTTR